jgi:hypothetical protein
MGTPNSIIIILSFHGGQLPMLFQPLWVYTVWIWALLPMSRRHMVPPSSRLKLLLQLCKLWRVNRFYANEALIERPRHLQVGVIIRCFTTLYQLQKCNIEWDITDDWIKDNRNERGSSRGQFYDPVPALKGLWNAIETEQPAPTVTVEPWTPGASDVLQIYPTHALISCEGETQG